MKTETRISWLSSYLVGESGQVGTFVGVLLDMGAICVWLVFLVAVMNVIAEFFSEQIAQLSIPILGAAIWWTYLRITRAWHHKQQMKLAKQKEQEEIERAYRERAGKN